MTANQIAYKKAKEDARHNKETEDLARRKERRESIHAGVKSITDVVKAFSPFQVSGKKNDYTWYNADPQLVKDTANISFNNPLGAATRTTFLGNEYRVPGIMTLGFIPTIGGSSETDSDAINVAAKQVYSFVRHANSGHANYESTDLFMYIESVIQLYSFIAYLRRLYSVANTFKGHNRYYGDAMLKALGCDPEDIRGNLAQLRAYINTLSLKANAFYIPGNLSLLKRRIWINSTLFKDQPVKKSQVYIFLQRSFGKYDSENGRVIFDPMGTDNLFNPELNKTLSILKKIGESMITALLASEDIGIMSGDILKAYGESAMAYIDNIPEDFHIEAEYSEEVLSQITNGMLMPPTSGELQFDIQQDDSGHIYQGTRLYNRTKARAEYGMLLPVILAPESPSADETSKVANLIETDTFVNFYKDDPSNDEIMVATRLMYASSDDIYRTTAFVGEGTYAHGVKVQTCGSELLTTATIITLSGENLLNDPSSIEKTVFSRVQTVSGDKLSQLMKFDWAPVIYLSSTLSYSHPMMGNTMDAANYAVVNRDTIQNMNFTALLSEYGVPYLGLKVRTR